MRVLILGNSHVACVRQAWDEFASTVPDANVTFFAARGARMDGLIPKDRMLVPTTPELIDSIRFTSGGLRSVPVSEADVVYLHGLRLLVRGPARGYSAAVIREMHADVARESMAYSLARKIRSISDVPIVAGHVPLAGAEPERCGGDLSEYYQTIRTLNEDVFAPLAAVLLPQPKATLCNSAHSHARFTVGSSRLAIGKRNDGVFHPADDNRHMNQDYGRFVLDDLFAFLRAHIAGDSRWPTAWPPTSVGDAE